MAGRFAPSPTGPLHLGSLLAATASYLEAHRRNTPWHLRFDDLDAPRSEPGAEDAIKQGLEDHALLWDGAVDHQSQHADAYADALNRLLDMDALFYCTCSRRQLRNSTTYPGTCRAHRAPRSDAALRLAVDDRMVHFEDAVQGPQKEAVSASVGDFIVRRRDGLVAYQLATAVDDGDPAIDHVVRGADLLDNTPRQLYLMELLELSVPTYAHVPVVLHPDGAKLSKQTGAAPVRSSNAPGNLVDVLTLLGAQPPPMARQWSCDEVLAWARPRWNLDNVPRVSGLIRPN